MRILIAESEGFSRTALERLRERAEVVEADLGRAGLLAAVGAAEILWVRLRHQIDREVLKAAPRLKVIVTNTTGINHIDVEAARERNIHVLSLRGDTELLTDVRGTAELTLGLMLALVRHVPAAVTHVRKGGWDRYTFKGHDLHQKTVGILGLGRLGRLVAGYLHALGVRVLATTPEGPLKETEGVQLVPFDELLHRCNLISVHVDLNPGTLRMFGAEQFGAMKQGSWFVNTARGEVVDEDALLAALESGRLSGAALDVLTNEAGLAGLNRPLLQYAATHNNLIITPHIGGYTFESLAKTEQHLANKLLLFWDQQACKSTA